MIVNDRHRFIFVHIPKNAGTSLATGLRALPGNNARWIAWSQHETLAEFHARVGGRRSLLDRIAGRTPRDYFAFAFVRNPWDRMVSLYRFLHEKSPRRKGRSLGSFEDFLLQARDGVAWVRALHSMRPQVEFCAPVDGQLRLGFLGHVEHLAEDIAAVAGRLGITLGLGHENRAASRARDYRREYTPATADIVATLFAEDCAHFGYAFEQAAPARRCSGPLNRPRWQ